MSANSSRDWAFEALLAGALAMGFSMPLGRLLLAASAVLLTVDAVRGRRRWRMPATAWLWLALVALAAVVTWQGINPQKGLHRLDKLFWYIGLPLAASLADSRARIWRVVQALLLGLGILSIRTLIANPAAARAVTDLLAQTRRPVTFSQALIDAGTLIDGQRLMIGLIGVAALWLGRERAARAGFERVSLTLEGRDGAGGVTGRLPLLPLLLGLLAAGELLALKRGSWFCSLALFSLMALRRVRFRWLALAALLLAVPVVVPHSPVRQRLADLRTEFDIHNGKGGRLVMWTQVAPALLRDHPWGIGFRSLTPEVMRSLAPGVEPRRDHLHSNLVEMATSLGWAGLALYLLWVACVLRDGWGSGGRPAPLFWMLLAILANGLVEYNFADAEIIIIFGLLAGLAAAGRRLGAAGLDGVARAA